MNKKPKRVFVAFLMDDTKLDSATNSNASALMSRFGVADSDLHKIKATIELSMDITDPQVVAVELKPDDAPRLKSALSTLDPDSELLLIGHGGKRLFSGLDGQSLHSELGKLGFKASCHINIISCKSAGDVAPSKAEDALSSGYISWARDFHRHLLADGHRCTVAARTSSMGIFRSGADAGKTYTRDIDNTKVRKALGGKIVFGYDEQNGGLVQNVRFR